MSFKKYIFGYLLTPQYIIDRWGNNFIRGVKGGGGVLFLIFILLVEVEVMCKFDIKWMRF